MKFRIEQVALYPKDPKAAIELLREMGMEDWVHDEVIAEGTVFQRHSVSNKAALAFNYEGLKDARELEVLSYLEGANWMSPSLPRVSHFGMHCTEAELVLWRKFFHRRDIGIAQEVDTKHHTNPAIAGQRWYKYVIFDTRSILGVDLKFIVRKDQP